MKINIRKWRSISADDRVAMLQAHIAKTFSNTRKRSLNLQQRLLLVGNVIKK